MSPGEPGPEGEGAVVASSSAFDFGDAPGPGTGTANYHTRLDEDGPRHRILAGLRLGSFVDDELDASPTAAADGDDIHNAAPDDEDGIGTSTGYLTVRGAEARSQ